MTIQKSYTKLENVLYIVNENNYTWAEGMLMDLKYGVADIYTSEYAFWYGIWKTLKFVTDIDDDKKAVALKKIEKKMEECK